MVVGAAMSRILVVGNEKGGCGKTTIAVNLAVLYAGAGVDVVMVDADPGQQSAMKWAARRSDNANGVPDVPCVSLTGRHLDRSLRDLANRCQQIVVDTGAEDSVELRAAATVADVLVVPVQPDPGDLWTLPTIEQLLDRARSVNEGLSCIVALNRVLHQAPDSLLSDFRAWTGQNCPGLPSEDVCHLVGRAAYARAMADGRGVSELPARRDRKAEAEITALWTVTNAKDIRGRRAEGRAPTKKRA